MVFNWDGNYPTCETEDIVIVPGKKVCCSLLGKFRASNRSGGYILLFDVECLTAELLVVRVAS